ncbi:DUF2570 family protein [Testudinibacter sp. P80/BLE/0925]
MLRLNPKWLAVVAVIVAILGYWWWLTSNLDEYRTLSQQQAQQITTLQTSLNQTKSQLTAEREAIQQQTALETQQRTQADDDQTAIKVELSAQDCAAVALPDGVIKRLQQ